MDRLIETIAEYLCRHKSVGLLRLTLDLTRRRLDLFAEIGAAEVDKGAVSPPTPGTDAWWRAVAAVREAVYVLRERALAQYVREAEVVSWIGRRVDSPTSTVRAPFKEAASHRLKHGIYKTLRPEPPVENKHNALMST